MKNILYSALIAGIIGGVSLWAINKSDGLVLGANQKVSELISYGTPIETDILPIVDITNSATKKITISSLFNFTSGTTTYMRDWSARSGTTTDLYFTNLLGASSTIYSLRVNNLLALSSTTLQAMTSSSSTIGTLLSNNATTTNFHVSNLASTTEIRSNVGNIGNLTVTSCTGCSSAGGATYYYATSTASSRYMAKTLSLVAGDIVHFGGSALDQANAGALTYRISSPWSMATTSVGTGVSVFFVFQATTTETVTFAYQPGGSVIGSMWIHVQNLGFSGQF